MNERAPEEPSNDLEININWAKEQLFDDMPSDQIEPMSQVLDILTKEIKESLTGFMRRRKEYLGDQDNLTNNT